MTSADRAIRVVVLYPEVMDVYADRGNLLAVQARCRALGVVCEVIEVGLGDALPDAADMVLIGGGQDREQRRIASDLAAKGVELRAWAEADTPMLAVCGGFQLFGTFYRTGAGEELPGVGLFDVITVAPPPGASRCIGDVLAHAPLCESVRDNAIRAATGDPRFPPVSAPELPALHLEISVLSAPRPVASYREIELGRHGIILSKHGQRALFLPQVAPEKGWTLEETLGHLAAKAGLPADAWREGAQFEVFTADVFGEKR